MNYFGHLLYRLKGRGATPRGFADVGAHFGETNELIKSVFPLTRVVSFEANPHCENELKMRQIEYLICLLGKENKDDETFFLNPNDLTSTGSSIYKEKSDFFKNASSVKIPMYRLDSIIPPEANIDFLKMDVQGAEIDVLEGATSILPSIKWVYLEVSFVNLNEGAPLFDDVYLYLRKHGYRIVDECDPTYINNTLLQTNFLFERI